MFTVKAPLFPTVSPPVMVDVAVVLVTLSLFIHAVSETVRYVDEALAETKLEPVILVVPVTVRLFNHAVSETVRYVDDALVIDPFVVTRVGRYAVEDAERVP